MFPNGLGRVMQVLVVCGVVVSAALVMRLRRIDANSVRPPQDIRKAVENYEQRMQQTDRILKRDRL